VPPTKTLKVPAEQKKQGAQLAVRAGDTIRICNNDLIIHKPFSYSPNNRFEGSGRAGLRPGECVTHVAKNPTAKPISFKLADALHAREQLSMIVLPENSAEAAEEDSASTADSAIDSTIPPAALILTLLDTKLLGQSRTEGAYTYTFGTKAVSVLLVGDPPDRRQWSWNFNGTIPGTLKPGDEITIKITGNLNITPPNARDFFNNSAKVWAKGLTVVTAENGYFYGGQYHDGLFKFKVPPYAEAAEIGFTSDGTGTFTVFVYGKNR